MRWAAVATIVCLCLLASACSGDDTVSTPGLSQALTLSTVPPTATPYNTNVPSFPDRQPDPTLPPEGDLQNRILGCLVAGPTTAADAAVSLPPCAASGAYTVSAKAADGDTAVLLIDAESLPDRCLNARSYVAWFKGDWHIQPALPNILEERDVFNRSAHGPRAVGPRAIVEANPSGVDLGIIYLVAGGCGSGPTEAFVLLQLDGDHWQRSWDSISDARTSFGHTNVDFAADDLGTLRINGDSWGRFDDLGNVFHESNPGPHRYFQQTWERQGDNYELVSETVTPSPYNTLVNFVYDIGVGDTSAAGALVTDPTLVQTAIDIGLTKDPNAAAWTGICGDWLQSGPPCEVDLPSGKQVQVDMVQSGDTWLVSGVGPAPSTVMPTSSIR